MNWRDLSTAYLLGVVNEKRYVNGVAACLHPDSLSLYTFIYNFLQQYKTFPTLQEIKQRFNLDINIQGMPGTQLESLADRLVNEKVRYDVQGTVVQLQNLLTTADLSDVNTYLAPILNLQNQLNMRVEEKIYRLSQWREITSMFLSGQETVKVANFGFPTLDKYTGGISKNNFIILYANTTQGKSTMARAIAANVAMQNKRLLYFTLEEEGSSSVIKTLSTLARVDAKSIIENNPNPETYHKLNSFAGNIPGDVIFVQNIENKNVAEIQRYVYQYSPDIIVLDQIPLFTPDGSMKVDDVTKVSRQLKGFCQSTGIPMIALTQANRLGIKVKKPTMEDTMAFAYALCQDGDIVIFLHPDEEGFGYTRKRATLLKNRNRQRGQTIDFKWQLDDGIIEEETSSMAEFQSQTVSSYYQQNQIVNPAFQQTVGQ